MLSAILSITIFSCNRPGKAPEKLITAVDTVPIPDTLYLANDTTLFLNGEIVFMDSLDVVLSEIKLKEGEAYVVLKTVGQVKVSSIERIMETLTRNHITIRLRVDN